MKTQNFKFNMINILVIKEEDQFVKMTKDNIAQAHIFLDLMNPQLKNRYHIHLLINHLIIFLLVNV